MNILLIGSGGREHALAWKIKQSPKCTRLFIAPGNAGTAELGENIPIKVDDFTALAEHALNNDIRMIVVGPEDPLVKGIADFFESDARLKHIIVIGPGKQGAQLEGSKDFSKQFMFRHKIPTAAYASFNKQTLEEGYAFLEKLKPPYVLKADGLAAGKGVLILENYDDACEELRNMVEHSKFGDAGNTVVIEEFLSGIELSVFILTDGKSYAILPEAKDYKRIGEGDTGLNTGGMGAVSPVPFADSDFMQKVEERIIRPTVEGLKRDDIGYKGFIFIGLMKVKDDPFVIEYNARMGDPETEVVIPRLQNDLVELFLAVADGTIGNVKIVTDKRTALTVILASGGYPGEFEKGKVISGLEPTHDCYVFHSGTTLQNGNLVTSGGRVIAVTSLGNSMEEAQLTAMQNAAIINFDKKYYRKDIGNDLR